MLKNARINKNKLVNYLKKRYTGRLVQKATSIFDFSNGNLEKEVFTKIKNCLNESSYKNVTLFSGWKDGGIFEKGKSREFYFKINEKAY